MIAAARFIRTTRAEALVAVSELVAVNRCFVVAALKSWSRAAFGVLLTTKVSAMKLPARS